MKENVLRGVALLDEKVPDWRERIEPEGLDMGRCGRCILGQLFGFYDIGLRQLKVASRAKSIKYGFDANTQSAKSKKWTELNQLWREQL